MKKSFIVIFLVMVSFAQKTKGQNIPPLVTDAPSHKLPGAKEIRRDNQRDNQKVKEAAKIVIERGNVIYEAEIKGRNFLFDGNGNFIKKDKAG